MMKDEKKLSVYLLKQKKNVKEEKGSNIFLQRILLERSFAQKKKWVTFYLIFSCREGKSFQ